MINKPKRCKTENLASKNDTNPNINKLSCKYDAHKTCFLKI